MTLDQVYTKGIDELLSVTQAMKALKDEVIKLTTTISEKDAEIVELKAQLKNE
jgi:hypothetical protein